MKVSTKARIAGVCSPMSRVVRPTTFKIAVRCMGSEFQVSGSKFLVFSRHESPCCGELET